jgi:hypothetical protein
MNRFRHWLRQTAWLVAAVVPATVAAQQINRVPRFIKNVATGQCLLHSEGYLNSYLAPCDASDQQQWFYVYVPQLNMEYPTPIANNGLVRIVAARSAIRRWTNTSLSGAALGPALWESAPKNADAGLEPSPPNANGHLLWVLKAVGNSTQQMTLVNNQTGLCFSSAPYAGTVRSEITPVCDPSRDAWTLLPIFNEAM